MNLSNAIRLRILRLCQKDHITLHQLSLKAGIPYSTLSSFMHNNKSIIISNLLHICEGLNIELKDFFNDSLFDNVIDE